jgi:hypothetical protein
VLDIADNVSMRADNIGSSDEVESQDIKPLLSMRLKGTSLDPVILGDDDDDDDNGANDNGRNRARKRIRVEDHNDGVHDTSSERSESLSPVPLADDVADQELSEGSAKSGNQDGPLYGPSVTDGLGVEDGNQHTRVRAVHDNDESEVVAQPHMPGSIHEELGSRAADNSARVSNKNKRQHQRRRDQMRILAFDDFLEEDKIRADFLAKCTETYTGDWKERGSTKLFRQWVLAQQSQVSSFPAIALANDDID